MNESSKKSPKYENTLLETFDSELIARLRLAPVVFKTGQKIEQAWQAHSLLVLSRQRDGLDDDDVSRRNRG